VKVWMVTFDMAREMRETGGQFKTENTKFRAKPNPWLVNPQEV